MEIPWSYEILTPKTAFQGFQGTSPHTAGARGRREAREPLRRRLRCAATPAQHAEDPRFWENRGKFKGKSDNTWEEHGTFMGFIYIYIEIDRGFRGKFMQHWDIHGNN